MTLDASIANLLAANRPPQLDILRTIVSALRESPAVTHLLVRGSFTTGRTDRSSDVDLVVCVEPHVLPQFVEVLGRFVRTCLGCLFPGWRDSIAPDLGGVGFVFLVPFQGALYELDIYVAPASSAPMIGSRGAILLYERTNDNTPASEWIKSSVDLADPDPVKTLLVEILVLFHLLSKRAARGHSFIVYGHSYLLNDAIRRLIKHQLAPHSKHWGWYHLEDDLPNHLIGRQCINELAALVSATPIRDISDLRRTFARIERIAESAAPDAWSDLTHEINAYRHYLGV